MRIESKRTWLCFCASVLFLPLFPALGALGLLVTMAVVGRRNYHQLIRGYLPRAWGILALILLVTTILADKPAAAGLGLANFLPFFALFLVLRNLITKPIQLRQLSWCLVLPSLPIVLLGFAQMYVAWDSPPLIETILGWELVPGGFPPGRMSSVFIYTNFLAIYLAIAIALTLGLWLAAWQQKITKKRTQILALLGLILLADTSGLILTSSRNAWGIVVFCLMAYAAYLGWSWLVWLFTGAISVTLWAAFAPSWGGSLLRIVVPSFIWMRLADTAYERPLATLRITQWQFCWDLITERPFWGWGLRNFSLLYEAKMNLWLGHPHNLFLMLGAEAGIVALFLLSGIVGAIAYSGCKLLATWSSPESPSIFFSYLVAFAACILFNLADVSIFDLRINTLGWILLAAISGVASSTSEQK
ncbi:MAG: O-antigen ligase family protein [Cyanobacteria bacterium J06623_7]